MNFKPHLVRIFRGPRPHDLLPAPPATAHARVLPSRVYCNPEMPAGWEPETTSERAAAGLAAVPRPASYRPSLSPDALAA